MRFKGKTPSGADKSVSVYNFTLGKTELIILRDVLNWLHSSVPKSLFTQPFTSRMESMRSEINKTLLADGITKRNTRPVGWNPEDTAEVF